MLAALLLGAALVTVGPTEPWSLPEGATRTALLASCVRAEGEPGWVRASGGAYVVRTDVSADFALDAACFMERLRSQLRAVFRDPPAEPWPPLVAVYKDEARYRRVTGPGRSRGMYVASAHTLYTYLDAKKGEGDFASFYSKILLHEGTHQLLGALVRAPMPPWFNEGTASFFQEWDVRASVDENLERLKTTHYRIRDVNAAFGTPRWVPLRRLLALDETTFDPDDFGPRTYLHYAESASFISFLLGDADGRRIFSRTYEALREQVALDNVFKPETVKALEASWLEEVKRRIEAAKGAGN